ncbi:unnamed protein product [Alopecurus aequalis]
MSSSALRDDATVASISMPREEEEEGNVGVNAGRRKRITYSREFLLAVSSSEACKKLPAGVHLSKHRDDATLWLLEVAARNCSSRAQIWRVRSAARSGESQGNLPQGAREPAESFQTSVGSKSKPCTRFFSTEGCRFGENCHFIHDYPGGYQAVANVGILDGPVSAQDEKGLPMVEQGPAGHHAPGQAPKPNPGTGTVATASFGASATAKISVDASLAGVVIGRGGATIKQISRASGARLCIREHESDASLKNVELEGTFDQIKDASEMVMEQLSRFSLGGDARPPAGAKNPAQVGFWKSGSFKTKLCGRLAKGSCDFGDRCRFAHDESELRRPVPAAREPGGW